MASANAAPSPLNGLKPGQRWPFTGQVVTWSSAESTAQREEDPPISPITCTMLAR